jgi:hypothetical protein
MAAKNYTTTLPQSKFSSTMPKFWKNIDPNIIQNGFKSRNFHSCNTIVSKAHKEGGQPKNCITVVNISAV